MKKILGTVLALAVVVACGGTGGNDVTTTSVSGTPTTGGGPTTTDTSPTTTEPSAPTTTEPTTTPTDPPPTPDHQLIISGMAFNVPSGVSVGELIEVVNQDPVPHTWTSTDGVFSSGSLSDGTTFLYTFEEAGTFSFLCTIHPEMTGSITVGG